MTTALATFLREKGFDPFVLSSATADGTAFLAACAGLGVEHHLSSSVTLTTEEVLDRARRVPGCRFCFTVADEQRHLMAQANQVLGARDVSPAAALLGLDKHLMRHRLVERGLSRLRPFVLADPELRARLDRGEPHIVKPRRGSGSLCTRVVSSWAEVRAQREAFERGPAEGDQWEAFFLDNELVAETYIEGRELSLELVRQGGRTVLAVEHEKTVLEFTDQTVLERGFAAPAVTLTEGEVAAVREYVDRCLDALGHDEGCYHVEVRLGAAGWCEIIEVNLRVGGGYLYESVLAQLDRSMGHEWVDGLLGEPLPALSLDRRCGTYLQNLYPEPGRQVIGMDRNPRLPVADKFAEVFKPGSVGAADPANATAKAMWTTDLAGHRETVAKLASEDYVSFVYAKGLAGRPLFLLFEPTNHCFQVAEAADRRGLDVVAFHTLPFPSSGPYAGSRASLAATHLVPSWTDVEAGLALVRSACEDHRVAGTYAAQEVTLQLEARVQELYGLPGRGLAVVRDLLNKVNVRRRLTDAGLTKLRFFEQAEALALDSWPVGDHALFFKPVRGAASAFVRRCRDLGEVRAAVAQWRSSDKAGIPVLGPHLASEGGEFFLEEQAAGELLSVEGFVHAGSYHAIGLTSRVVLARDVAVEMGSTYPYDHPRADEIVDTVARMHAALGIEHGATHAEVIVPADGPIELVEMNLRFGGGDALWAMNAAHDVNLEEDLVALATGETPRLRFDRRRFTCLHELLAPSGLARLDSIELPADELAFLKIMKPPGSELASTDRQIDHIASFVVSGASHEEALRRAMDVRRRAMVNGRPLGDDPNNIVIGR